MRHLEFSTSNGAKACIFFASDFDADFRRYAQYAGREKLIMSYSDGSIYSFDGGDESEALAGDSVKPHAEMWDGVVGGYVERRIDREGHKTFVLFGDIRLSISAGAAESRLEFVRGDELIALFTGVV